MPASVSVTDAYTLTACEGQRTSVGEARGQDEDVVGAPSVGEDELLGNLHELFHVVLELPLAGLELVGARGHDGAGSDGGGGNVARGDGKEVRGDGHLLLEAVRLGGAGGSLVVADGDTAGDDGQGRGEVEVKGGLDVRGVLAGEDGAGVDGLALGEHVGVALVGRLGGREPLQGGAAVRRLDVNGQVDGVASRGTLGDGHVQRRAQGLAVGANLPARRGGAVDLHAGDLDEARVENDLVALAVRLGLEAEDDGAAQALGLKVELKVDRRVPGAPRAIVGQRARVTLGGGGHPDAGGADAADAAADADAAVGLGADGREAAVGRG